MLCSHPGAALAAAENEVVATLQTGSQIRDAYSAAGDDVAAARHLTRTFPHHPPSFSSSSSSWSPSSCCC